MDTQTQIERLIELAIVQRTELKQLVEQLPQLREHLNAEIERNLEEVEPQIRSELEEFCDKRAVDANAKVGSALEAKIVELSKSLEVTTQARFNAIKEQERKVEELRQLAAKQIEGHVATLPEAVKEIVGAELARFPRAGEIDQLRKEFAEPRGLNPRGKWLPSETYNKLDLVTWNGDSYVSNIDGNRERPARNSSTWTLSAARGIGGGGPSDLSALTAVPSNGSLLIGSGTSWVNGNIVAGAGINVTNGAGSITISATDGDITLDDGTAASPSLHFTNDADTGIYRPAANTLGISVSGTQVAYFDQNGLTVPSAGVVAGGSIHAANGNANNPSLSFSGDQDTGFFRHQPNEIGIALGSTQYATLTSTTFSVTPALSIAGVSRVTNSTTSSSTTTGALVVTGGVGIGGAANVGGNVTVSGTTGVTSTDVILGSSGPSVKSTLSARAPRQGLVFDGTASASGTLGALGAADFSASFFCNPASLAATQFLIAQDSGFVLAITTSGTIISSQRYVGDNTASTGTVSAGKWSHVTYVRSGTTGTYYINGISAGTTTDSRNYGSSAATFAFGGQISASQYFSGAISQGLIYNRALSSSEVVALYEAGAPAGADYNNAGVKTTSFNSGASSATQSGTSATGGTLTFAGAGASALVWTLSQVTELRVGQKYLVTFNATLTSGSVPVVLLNDIGIATRSNTPTVTAGANSHILTVSATSTTSSIGLTFFAASGATTYSISNISVTALGLLLAPDAYQAGNGLVWTDLSGNGTQILLPTSGVSWNVPSTGTTRIRSYSYTNGNQQLFGASCVPVGYRIVSIAARLQAGGSPNVTLGSASGLSDYAASIAVTSTSWKYIPVASGGEITTTANIWASGTSTAVVLWDIIVQPLGV